MLLCVVLVLALATVFTGCELSEPVEEPTYYIASGDIEGEPNYYYRDHTTTKERVDEFTDSINSLRTYLDGESFVDTGYYMAVNYAIDILDQENRTAGNFELRVNAYLYTYPYEIENEDGSVTPIYKYYENGRYYDENNEQGTRKLVNALEIHNEAIKKSDISIEWYNGATNEVMIGLYFDGLNSNSDNPGNILYVDIQGARRSFPDFGDTVLYQQMIRLLVHLSVEGLLESLGLQDDAGTGTINTYMTNLIGENSRRVVNGNIVSLYFYQVVLNVIAGNVTEMLYNMFGRFGRKWDPLTYKYLGFRFSTVANASVSTLEVDMQGVVSPDKEGNTDVLTDAVFDLRGSLRDQKDVPYSYTSHITFDYGWVYPDSGLQVENVDWYEVFEYGNYEFQGMLYVPSWDAQFDALIRTDMQPYDNRTNNVFMEFRDIANGELMMGVYYKNERSYLDITGLQYMYGWIDLESLGFPQVYDEHLDLAYTLKQFFKILNNTIVSIVDSILNPASEDKKNQALDYIIAKTEITEKIEFTTEDEEKYRQALNSGTEALITVDDIEELMIDAGFGKDVAKIIAENPDREEARRYLAALSYFDTNTEEGLAGLEEALSWHDKIGLTVAELTRQLEAEQKDESYVNKVVKSYIDEAVMRKKRISLFSANTEQLTVDIELVKQMLEETGAGTFTTRQLINIADSVLPYTLDQLAVMLGVASAELMVEKTYFDLKLDVDTNEMTVMMKTNLGVEPGDPSTLMWQLELTPVRFGKKVAIADVDFSKFKPLGEIYTYSGTLKGNFVFSAAESVDLSKLLSATIGESSGLNTPYVLPHNVGVYMEMVYDQFVTDNYVNDDGIAVPETDPNGYWKLQGRSAFDVTMKIMGEDTVIIRLCTDDVCFDNDIYKMLGDEHTKEENSEAEDLLGYIWVSIECVTKNGEQAIPKVKIREDIFMASMSAYMNGAEEITDDVTSFAENDFNMSLTSMISALCKDAYVVAEPEQMEITSSNETLQSLFRVDGLIGNIKVDAGFTYRVKGLESIKPNYYLHQVGEFTDLEGNSPYDTALHEILETYFYTDRSDEYVLRDSTKYTNDYENYGEAHRRNKTVVTECDYHVFAQDILLDDGTLIEAGTLVLFELGAKRTIAREHIETSANSFFSAEPDENQDISKVRFLLGSLEGLVSEEGGGYYYRNFFNNYVRIDSDYVFEDNINKVVYIYWQGVRDVVFYESGSTYYFFDMNKAMYYLEDTEDNRQGDPLYMYQAEDRRLLFEYDEESVGITAACKTQYSPRTKGSFMGVVRRYYVVFTTIVDEELGSLYGVYFDEFGSSGIPQYYTVAPEGDQTYSYDNNNAVKVFDDDGKLIDWYYDPIALFVMEPAEALATSAVFNVCTDPNRRSESNETNWTPESTAPHDRSIWLATGIYRFNCEFVIDWDSVTLDGTMVVTEIVVARGMMGETVYPCRIVVTNRRIKTKETASVFDEEEYLYKPVEVEAGETIPEGTYYVVEEGAYVLTGDAKFIDGTVYYVKEYRALTVPVVDSYDVDPYEYLMAKYEYLSEMNNFNTSSVQTAEQYKALYDVSEKNFINYYFSKVVFDILFDWEKSRLYEMGVFDEYIAKSYTNMEKGAIVVYNWNFDCTDMGNNLEKLINPAGGVVYIHTRFYGQAIALRINVGKRDFAYLKFNTVDGNGNVIEDTYSYRDMQNSKTTFGLTVNGVYVANYYDETTYKIGTQPVFVFVDEDNIEYEYVFDMRIITGVTASGYSENLSYELSWSNSVISNVGSEGSYYPEYYYTDLYDVDFVTPIKEAETQYDGTGEFALDDAQRNTYIDRFVPVTTSAGLPVLYEELSSEQKTERVYVYGVTAQQYLYSQDEDGFALVRTPLYRSEKGAAQILSTEVYAEESEYIRTYRNEPIPYGSLSLEQKSRNVRIHTAVGTITTGYLYTQDGDGYAMIRKSYEFGTVYHAYAKYAFLTMKVLVGKEVAYTDLTPERQEKYVFIADDEEMKLFVNEHGVAKILKGRLYKQDEFSYVTLSDGVTKVPYRILSADKKAELVTVDGMTEKLPLYRADGDGYAQIRDVKYYSKETDVYYEYEFTDDTPTVDVSRAEGQRKVILYNEGQEKDLFREQNGSVEIRKADIYTPKELVAASVRYDGLPQTMKNEIVLTVGGDLMPLYRDDGTGATETLKVVAYRDEYAPFETVNGDAVEYELLSDAMRSSEVSVTDRATRMPLFRKNASGNAETLLPDAFDTAYLPYSEYGFNDYYLVIENASHEKYLYANLSEEGQQKTVTVAGREKEETYYINVGGYVAVRLGYWYTENEWERLEIPYSERMGGTISFSALGSLSETVLAKKGVVLRKDYSGELFRVSPVTGKMEIRKKLLDGDGTLQLYLNGNPVRYADLTIEEATSGVFGANRSGYAVVLIGELYGEEWTELTIGGATVAPSGLTEAVRGQKVIVRPDGLESNLYELSEEDGYARKRRNYTDNPSAYMLNEYRVVEYGSKKAYLYVFDGEGNLSMRSDETRNVNRPFYRYYYIDDGNEVLVYKGSEYVYTYRPYTVNGATVAYSSLTDEEKGDAITGGGGTVYPTYLAATQVDVVGDTDSYIYNGSSVKSGDAYVRVDITLDSENTSQVTMSTLNFYYLFRLFAVIDGETVPISIVTGDVILSEIPGESSRTDYPSVTARIVVECPKLEPAILDEEVEDYYLDSGFRPNDVDIANYSDLFRVGPTTGLAEIRIAKNYDGEATQIYIDGEAVHYDNALTGSEKEENYFGYNKAGWVTLKTASTYTEQWKVFSIAGRTFTTLRSLSEELRNKKVAVGESVSGYYRVDPLKASTVYLPDTVTVWFAGEGVRQGHGFSDLEWHAYFDETTGEGFDQIDYIDRDGLPQRITVVERNADGRYEVKLPLDTPLTTRIMTRIGNETSGYKYLTVALQILSKDPTQILFYPDMASAEADNELEEGGRDRVSYNKNIVQRSVTLNGKDASEKNTTDTHMYFTYTVNTFDKVELPPVIVACFTTHYTAYEVRWMTLEGKDFDFALKPNTTVHLVSYITAVENGVETVVDLNVYLDIIVQNYVLKGEESFVMPSDSDAEGRSYFGQYVQVSFGTDTREYCKLSDLVRLKPDSSGLYAELGLYAVNDRGDYGYIVISTGSGLDVDGSEEHEKVPAGKIGLFNAIKEDGEIAYYELASYKGLYEFLQIVYKMADITVEIERQTYAIPYTEAMFVDLSDGTSTTFSNLSNMTITYLADGRFGVTTYYRNATTGHTYSLKVDKNAKGVDVVNVRDAAQSVYTVPLYELMTALIDDALRGSENINADGILVSDGRDIRDWTIGQVQINGRVATEFAGKRVSDVVRMQAGGIQSDLGNFTSIALKKGGDTLEMTKGEFDYRIGYLYDVIDLPTAESDRKVKLTKEIPINNLYTILNVNDLISYVETSGETTVIRSLTYDKFRTGDKYGKYTVSLGKGVGSYDLICVPVFYGGYYLPQSARSVDITAYSETGEALYANGYVMQREVYVTVENALSLNGNIYSNEVSPFVYGGTESGLTDWYVERTTNIPAELLQKGDLVTYIPAGVIYATGDNSGGYFTASSLTPEGFRISMDFMTETFPYSTDRFVTTSYDKSSPFVITEDNPGLIIIDNLYDYESKKDVYFGSTAYLPTTLDVTIGTGRTNENGEAIMQVITVRDVVWTLEGSWMSLVDTLSYKGTGGVVRMATAKVLGCTVVEDGRQVRIGQITLTLSIIIRSAEIEMLPWENTVGLKTETLGEGASRKYAVYVDTFNDVGSSAFTSAGTFTLPTGFVARFAAEEGGMANRTATFNDVVYMLNGRIVTKIYYNTKGIDIERMVGPGEELNGVELGPDNVRRLNLSVSLGFGQTLNMFFCFYDKSQQVTEPIYSITDEAMRTAIKDVLVDSLTAYEESLIGSVNVKRIRYNLEQLLAEAQEFYNLIVTRYLPAAGEIQDLKTETAIRDKLLEQVVGLYQSDMETVALGDVTSAGEAWSDNECNLYASYYMLRTAETVADEYAPLILAVIAKSTVSTKLKSVDAQLTALKNDFATKGYSLIIQKYLEKEFSVLFADYFDGLSKSDFSKAVAYKNAIEGGFDVESVIAKVRSLRNMVEAGTNISLCERQLDLTYAALYGHIGEPDQANPARHLYRAIIIDEMYRAILRADERFGLRYNGRFVVGSNDSLLAIRNATVNSLFIRMGIDENYYYYKKDDFAAIRAGGGTACVIDSNGFYVPTDDFIGRKDEDRYVYTTAGYALQTFDRNTGYPITTMTVGKVTAVYSYYERSAFARTAGKATGLYGGSVAVPDGLTGVDMDGFIEAAQSALPSGDIRMTTEAVVERWFDFAEASASLGEFFDLQSDIIEDNFTRINNYASSINTIRKNIVNGSDPTSPIQTLIRKAVDNFLTGVYMEQRYVSAIIEARALNGEREKVYVLPAEKDYGAYVSYYLPTQFNTAGETVTQAAFLGAELYEMNENGYFFRTKDETYDATKYYYTFEPYTSDRRYLPVTVQQSSLNTSILTVGAGMSVPTGGKYYEYDAALKDYKQTEDATFIFRKQYYYDGDAQQLLAAMPTVEAYGTSSEAQFSSAPYYIFNRIGSMLAADEQNVVAAVGQPLADLHEASGAPRRFFRYSTEQKRFYEATDTVFSGSYNYFTRTSMTGENVPIGSKISVESDTNNALVETTPVSSTRYYVYIPVILNADAASVTVKAGERIGDVSYAARTIRYTYEPVDLVGETFDSNLIYYTYNEITRSYVAQTMTAFVHGTTYYTMFRRVASGEEYDREKTYYVYSNADGEMKQVTITGFEAGQTYYVSNVRYDNVVLGELFDPEETYYLYNAALGTYEKQVGMTGFTQDPTSYRKLRYGEIDPRDSVNVLTTYYIRLGDGSYRALDSIHEFASGVEYYTRNADLTYVGGVTNDYYVLRADGRYYPVEDEKFMAGHVYYTRQVARAYDHVGLNEAYEYKIGNLLSTGSGAFMIALDMPKPYRYTELYRMDSYYDYRVVPSDYIVIFDEEAGGGSYSATIKWRNDTVSGKATYEGGSASLYGTLTGNSSGEAQQVGIMAEIVGHKDDGGSREITSKEIYLAELYFTAYRKILERASAGNYTAAYVAEMKEIGEKLTSVYSDCKLGGTAFATAVYDYLTYLVEHTGEFTGGGNAMTAEKENAVLDKMNSFGKETGCFGATTVLYTKAGEKGAYVAVYVETAGSVWKVSTFTRYDEEGYAVYRVKNKYSAAGLNKQSVSVYNPFAFAKADMPSYVMIGGKPTPVVWKGISVLPTGNLNADSHTVFGNIINENGQEVSIELYVASWQYKGIYQPSDKPTQDVYEGEYYAYMSPLAFYFSAYSSYSANDKYLVSFVVSIREDNATTGVSEVKDVTLSPWKFESTYHDGVEQKQGVVRKLFYPYTDSTAYAASSALLEYGTSDDTRAEVMFRQRYLLYWDENALLALLTGDHRMRTGDIALGNKEIGSYTLTALSGQATAVKGSYNYERMSIESIQIVTENTQTGTGTNIAGEETVDITFPYDEVEWQIAGYGNNPDAGRLTGGETVVVVNGKKYIYNMVYGTYTDGVAEYTQTEMSALVRAADRDVTGELNLTVSGHDLTYYIGVVRLSEPKFYDMTGQEVARGTLFDIIAAAASMTGTVTTTSHGTTTRYSVAAAGGEFVFVGGGDTLSESRFYAEVAANADAVQGVLNVKSGEELSVYTVSFFELGYYDASGNPQDLASVQNDIAYSQEEYTSGEAVVLTGGKKTTYTVGRVAQGSEILQYTDRATRATYTASEFLQIVSQADSRAKYYRYNADAEGYEESETGDWYGVTTGRQTTYYTVNITAYLDEKGRFVEASTVEAQKAEADTEATGVFIVTQNGTSYSYSVIAVKDGDEVRLKYFDSLGFEMEESTLMAMADTSGQYGYITLTAKGIATEYAIRRVATGLGMETFYYDETDPYSAEEMATMLKNSDKRIYRTNVSGMQIGDKSYYYNAAGQLFTDKNKTVRASGMSIDSREKTAYIGNMWYMFDEDGKVVRLIQNICLSCHKRLTVTDLGDMRYRIECTTEGCAGSGHSVVYDALTGEARCNCDDCLLYDEIKSGLVGRSGEVIFVTDINSTYPVSPAELNLLTNYVDYRHDSMSVRLLWNSTYDDVIRGMKAFVAACYPDVDATAQEQYARNILMKWPTMSESEREGVLSLAMGYMKDKNAKVKDYSDVDARVDACKMLAIEEKFDFSSDAQWLRGSGNTTVPVTVLILVDGSATVYRETINVRLIFGDYNPLGYYQSSGLTAQTKTFNEYELSATTQDQNSSYEAVRVTASMRDKNIPKNTYFEYSEIKNAYALTADKKFVAGKTYYRLKTSSMYIGVRTDYWKDGQNAYEAEGLTPPYDNIGDAAYKLLEFASRKQRKGFEQKGDIIVGQCYMIQVLNVYWTYNAETNELTSEKFSILIDDVAYEVESTLLSMTLSK